MSKSNFNKNNTTPETSKVKLNKELGVYIFIDEDGNVKQIQKEKKDRKKYYPNIPTKVDDIIGDVYVIGVSDTVAMGAGDNTMIYAKYI